MAVFATGNPDYLEQWADILPVLEQYSVVINRDIEVSNPHGHISPLVVDDDFHIRFWSTPSPSNATTLGSVFRLRTVNGQSDAREPVPGGLNIVDLDGNTVAQLFEDTLYVLFDLPHGGSHAAAMMERIMEATVELYNSTPHASMTQEEKLELSRQRFIDLHTKALQRLIDHSEQTISEYDGDIEELEEKLIDALRQRQQFQEELAAAQQILVNQDQTAIEARFEEMLRLSKEGNLTISAVSISVFIGQVDVAFKGVTYDIGEFSIIIYPGGEHSGVRCINRTRTIEKPVTGGHYYHPHVQADGSCCLGNIETIVSHLIATMRYDHAILLIRSFLQSVNPDGWYVSVNHWPIKAS